MKPLLVLVSAVLAVSATVKGVCCALGPKPELCSTYHGDGRLKNSTSYLSGQKHGRCEQWREDGSKEFEGVYERGLRSGLWMFWDAAGRLDSARSGEYRAGRRVDG